MCGPEWGEIKKVFCSRRIGCVVYVETSSCEWAEFVVEDLDQEMDSSWSSGKKSGRSSRPSEES